MILLRLPRVFLFLLLIAVGLLLTAIGELFVKAAAWVEDVEYVMPENDDIDL